MSNNVVFSIYRASNEVAGEPILYREHLSQDAPEDADASVTPRASSTATTEENA